MYDCLCDFQRLKEEETKHFLLTQSSVSRKVLPTGATLQLEYPSAHMADISARCAIFTR